MAVYLDHAASTAMRVEVAQLVSSMQTTIGNPNSVHAFGQAAKANLEQSRETIATALNCDRNEVIFTSGGTEANNLAVLGLFEARNKDIKRPIVVCLPTEHHAVLEACEYLERTADAQLELIPVNSMGQPDLEWLAQFLDLNQDRVALVATIWCNNETGVIVDLAGIAEICKRLHIPLHTDAVAAVGHIDVDFAALGVSTLAFAGHKIGAGLGSGGLLVGRSVKVSPRAFGGSQERAIRPGTQDVVAAAGLAEAVRLATAELEPSRAHWAQLRERLIRGLQAQLANFIVVGEETASERQLANICNIVFPGCAGESLLFLLDTAGVAISNGSACNAGVVGGSHVLKAMGLSDRDSASPVRVSLGVSTTEADIDAFLAAIGPAQERALAAGFTI